jgi:hypothetical protein
MNTDINTRLGRIVTELDDMELELRGDVPRRANAKSKAVQKALHAVMEARNEIAVGEMVNAAAHDAGIVGEGNVINGPIPYRIVREASHAL